MHAQNASDVYQSGCALLHVDALLCRLSLSPVDNGGVQDGRTPLHTAAGAGYPLVVQALRDMGGDKDCKDRVRFRLHEQMDCTRMRGACSYRMRSPACSPPNLGIQGPEKHEVQIH